MSRWGTAGHKRGPVHVGHWRASDQPGLAPIDRRYSHVVRQVTGDGKQVARFEAAVGRNGTVIGASALRENAENTSANAVHGASQIDRANPLVIAQIKLHNTRIAWLKSRFPENTVNGDSKQDIENCANILKIPEARRPAFKQLIVDFLKAGDAAMVRASDDTRLSRLQARYEQRMRDIILPPGGFTTKEQAKAAHRLSSTLRDLQRVQRELGLPLTQKPECVREAERLRQAYEHHHTKGGEYIAPQPRGRPRRDAVPPI